MKELSIEQKAEAYDKALERAKNEYLTHESFNNGFCKMLANIFPELKECEDECIRKELISLVLKVMGREKDNLNDKTYDSMIAWLEKQGMSYTKKDVDDAYLKGISDAKEELEKQSEPKPTWDEEDEKRFNRIADFIWKNRKGDTDEIYQQEQDVNWLKSLKPQPKQEWSEEDERLFGGVVWHLRNSVNNGDKRHSAGQLEDWLESLKDRHTWKPSEEIMKGLNEIINKLAISPVIHEHGYLYVLMVNLRKKLTE